MSLSISVLVQCIVFWYLPLPVTHTNSACRLRWAACLHRVLLRAAGGSKCGCMETGVLRPGAARLVVAIVWSLLLPWVAFPSIEDSNMTFCHLAKGFG